MCSIGKAAAESAEGTLPTSMLDAHPSQIDIMHRHGLLVKKDTRTFQLSALSTATMLKLHSPSPMHSSPRSSDVTVVEMRYELVRMGWTLVGKPTECQLASRKCLSCQCSGYFQLIIHQLESIARLAQGKAFSHSQQKGYYNAVRLVCAHLQVAACLASNIQCYF